MLLVNADQSAHSIDASRPGNMKACLGASQHGSTNLTFALIVKHVPGLNVEAISGSARTAKTQP
jgi:hypothetical protein